MFKKLLTWLARNEIAQLHIYYSNKINEYLVQQKANAEIKKLMQKHIDDLVHAVRTNEYITEKSVMIPTEAVKKRIKEGKVCAACLNDLDFLKNQSTIISKGD